MNRTILAFPAISEKHRGNYNLVVSLKEEIMNIKVDTMLAIICIISAIVEGFTMNIPAASGWTCAAAALFRLASFEEC